MISVDNRDNLTKYMEMANEYGMLNARLITPGDIVFDIRAILKCRWGCENFFRKDIRCHTRDTSFDERVAMINKYSHILLLHSNSARSISIAALKIERAAFLDGCYFAFALRYCNICEVCSVNLGEECKNPDQLRPCDQSFGIDVYKTVRQLGLPCEVLRDRNSEQNRYGFVLID